MTGELVHLAKRPLPVAGIGELLKEKGVPETPKK